VQRRRRRGRRGFDASFRVLPTRSHATAGLSESVDTEGVDALSSRSGAAGEGPWRSRCRTSARLRPLSHAHL
jgi:hypothetical protein